MNIIHYTPRRLSPLTREQRRRRQYIRGCVTGIGAMAGLIVIGILLGRTLGI